MLILGYDRNSPKLYNLCNYKFCYVESDVFIREVITKFMKNKKNQTN